MLGLCGKMLKCLRMGVKRRCWCHFNKHIKTSQNMCISCVSDFTIIKLNMIYMVHYNIQCMHTHTTHTKQVNSSCLVLKNLTKIAELMLCVQHQLLLHIYCFTSTTNFSLWEKCTYKMFSVRCEIKASR